MNLMRMALVALAASLSMGLVMESAQAARLGGGRSLGAQRPVAQRQATPPQQQAAQPQQGATTPNRWLGPLAGLAAGLGLGWLFANGGGPMLLALLVLGSAIVLIRYLMNRQRMAQAGAGPQLMPYAGLGNETVAAPPPSQIPAYASWGGGQPQAASIPPGFDTAGFLKQAKLNFIRLQEANDCADLDTLRDVSTDKLYEELAADIRHRTGTQHTDIVTLEASLLEVVTESDSHWASVRFSGMIRASAGAAPSSFAEVWHLSKPVHGDAGWLVAGIEQVS